MIWYKRNLKSWSRKFLQIISTFNKVVGYKINIQNPVAFIYKIDNWIKEEIKEIIPFTIASKAKQNKTKILGISLTKQVKDCIIKALRQWWNKLKITSEDGRFFKTHESVRLI